MGDHRIELVAVAPDEDTSARFRAEVLKLTDLYGVRVAQLTSGDKPSLTVLPGGRDDPAGAA